MANGQNIISSFERHGCLDKLLPPLIRDTLSFGGRFSKEGIIVAVLSAMVNHKPSTNGVVFIGGEHVTILIENSEAHSIGMLGK